MPYTSKERLEIAQAKIKLDRTGHPSTVARINFMVEQDAPFSKIQSLYKIPKVKPEKAVPVEATYDHPPLSGKGSGSGPWRAFAKMVSDMDPDIIDSMGKSDLITVLRDKGVID